MSLPERGPDSDAAGFVLAGGESSRMGADKALIQLAGQPLVARALSILRQARLVASIAGARTPLAAYAPVVEDPEPALGPLAGICAALESSRVQYAVFLPVDLPLLPASLVAYMVQHARITNAAVAVPSVNGYPQTFPSVVDRCTLPALETTLREGRRGCFSAFRAAAGQSGRPFSILAVELLVQCGQIAHADSLPAALWFHNVNTPEELQRAESILAHPHRVS